VQTRLLHQPQSHHSPLLLQPNKQLGSAADESAKWSLKEVKKSTIRRLAGKGKKQPRPLRPAWAGKRVGDERVFGAALTGVVTFEQGWSTSETPGGDRRPPLGKYG
jgi:hypothetical protein